MTDGKASIQPSLRHVFHRKPRVSRLIQANRGCVIVALDHGLTSGPMAGIESLEPVMEELSQIPPDGIIVNVGIIRLIPAGLFRRTVVMAQLSGGHSRTGTRPGVLYEVEHALAAGADAVCCQMNLGAGGEADVLEACARVASAAARLGCPALAMSYPYRGATIERTPEALSHACRTAAELGFDMVKTASSDPMEALHTVVQSCPVPVFIAGGPLLPGPEFLRLAAQVRASGAAGLCIGRNFFQASDRGAILRQLLSPGAE